MTCINKIYRRDLGYMLHTPETFQFPGGEWHLRNLNEGWLKDNWRDIALVSHVHGADPNGLVRAALWADVAHETGCPFVLMLPYAPAARADRGLPGGARVYAQIINSMRADTVAVLDPHSWEGSYRIDHLLVVDHLPLLQKVLDRHTGYDGLICPDKGATERSEKAAEVLGLDLYHADKKRDFATGKILGIKMVDELPRNGKYLVVDDICDGGGTFRGLADATELPRERLGLWVTHGIFSGRARDLFLDYEKIFTTNSHPGAELFRPTELVHVGHYMKDQVFGEVH